MITFALLLVLLLAIIIVPALIVIAGGAGVILALCDLAVCGAIIWLIIRIFGWRK